MKEISYGEFSLQKHSAAADGKIVSAQFELTFRCGLRCRHCYCACYNNRDFLKEELSLEDVRSILDELKHSGALWLCLTGGDPLSRPDFPLIYSYAVKLGFIVTVFTPADRLSADTEECLRKNPPFLMEVTVNACDEFLYERISGVKGSYKRVMANLLRLKKAGVPLKIKTQITRDNFGRTAPVEDFARGQGFLYSDTYDLYPTLEGDVSVCALRVPPEQIARGRTGPPGDPLRCSFPRRQGRGPDRVFFCPAGEGRELYIDPRGRVFLCPLIRNTGVVLLRRGVRGALARLRPLFLDRRYRGWSECRKCRLSAYCLRCPGEAYLETGDPEAPVPYYCELAGRLSAAGRRAR